MVLQNESLKSACNKGHNWINTEVEKLASFVGADKFKTISNGYNKIRPKMLAKGLSTFTNAVVDLDDDSGEYFKSNQKAETFDFRFIEDIEKNDEILQVWLTESTDITSSDSDTEVPPEETLASPKSSGLQILTTSKKRRHSKQDIKIVIKSNEDENVKILPGVLLTYNEKYLNINESDQKIGTCCHTRNRLNSLKSFDEI
ncbi:unnamed protein product [Diamesa serratosioi]